ncbi:hypothetical protein BC829DRAFT_7109 [Chytridium lagenaria]|nr:hypothetical protein BC829DRAFT_7109 [Chytridium lagenaria]
MLCWNAALRFFALKKMVVPQNNDEDVRGLVALISSDAQVDPETLVHSLKEILRDLQSNNRPVEDIVALVPVLVQLLEITGDSNIVDICCQCLELSAYNLSPADLLNKFESFLLECLWHTSSRMRQMCLRIMEAKSNSLSSVTEFVRSKFFSKALDVLLDVKQVGHSEKILELFQKVMQTFKLLLILNRLHVGAYL